jgi:hypothetical protein
VNVKWKAVRTVISAPTTKIMAPIFFITSLCLVKPTVI